MFKLIYAGPFSKVRRGKWAAALLPALLFCTHLYAQQETPAKKPAVIKARHLSLHGEPLYKEGFTHFDYVNPDAPKGGSVTLYALGTYDNFHRFALRGDCAAGYDYFYDTLMAGSDDEEDVLYPLIAESVEYAADYSYIIFHINKNAKDQEGQPLTAEDAAFSFRLLFEHGVPQFRAFFANVTVRVLDTYRVRFDLGTGSEKELMMSLAVSTVFPKRYWEGPDGKLMRDFSQPLTTPPLGTGKYCVSDYKMGQYIVLERIKNYWAAELPVNKGRYNFDTIRYDYYLDMNVAFEAFKAGEYDWRSENSASNWAVGYTGKNIENGRIIREELPRNTAVPMQNFSFNTERPLFSDRRVRMALTFFFDFNWMNKNLFHNQYGRLHSYFQNTEYEAKGMPSPEELAELAVLRGKVPPEVFGEAYHPPATDGTGYIRAQAREALRLFAEAGWNLKDGKLLNAKGEQFSFELLFYDTATERYAIPFKNNLEKYGINMQLRMVDVSQFINRLRIRDFDMTSSVISAMHYPSENLKFYWHSAYIDSTYNTPGVRDEAVDYLCDQLSLSQENPERLRTLGRVLDRVLTWNVYCIPQWYAATYRLAYNHKLARPARLPRHTIGFESWWIKGD